MRRIVIPVLTLALVSAIVPQAAHAAGPVKSITLSPSSTALTIEPDVRANRDITIINDGDVAYTVDLNVAPYRVEDDDYDPVFTRLPGTTDPTQWVTLSQTTATLAAHETKTIGYTVNAPAATAPGGYYAVIFAETTNPATGGVSARNRVGDILYMTVDGQVKQGGSIAASDSPGFTFGSGTTLGTKVTNTGGVHFQTDAHFIVKGLTGNTVFDKTNQLYVLPQTTRRITQRFEPGSIAGIYKLSRSASVAGDTKTLPDGWIVIVKPQVIPLVIFGLLTLIGFFMLLRRTKKSPKKK